MTTIAELRQWYNERVRGLLGSGAADMALPVAAARWLKDEIVRLKPKVIVELGAGFSTLVFAQALRELPGTTLISADHDPAWIKFVRALLKQRKLPLERVQHMSVSEFFAAQRNFDFVFVDHGPTYADRIASIVPLVRLARRVGCDHIVLDDWHKNKRRFPLYKKPVLASLKPLGCSVSSITNSSTKKDQRELGRVVFSGVRPYAKLYGLQRSGTNWLSWLLQKNFNAIVLTHVLGDKHGIPAPTLDTSTWRSPRLAGHLGLSDVHRPEDFLRAFERKDIEMVMIVRSPAQWLQSASRYWKSKREEQTIEQLAETWNHTTEAYLDFLQSEWPTTIFWYDALVKDTGLLRKLSLPSPDEIVSTSKYMRPGGDGWTSSQLQGDTDFKYRTPVEDKFVEAAEKWIDPRVWKAAEEAGA